MDNRKVEDGNVGGVKIGNYIKGLWVFDYGVNGN